MANDAHEVYRRYVSSIVLHGLATAQALGLNATDLYAHNLLDLAGRMTSGELAARTGLTTGATTRLIDRLEKGGHLRRVTDPADRRKVYVEAVGGHDAVEKVMDPARRRVGAIIGQCTDEQRAVLFSYFASAAEAYREAVTEVQELHPPTP